MLSVIDVLLLLSFIDLNLKIVKGLPPYPMRVCLNSTGPGMLIFIRRAIMSMSGASSMSVTKVRRRERIRLIWFFELRDFSEVSDLSELSDVSDGETLAKWRR